MSKDDSAIKEESRQIKCESSPPTPRSLRLERVAQALAQSSEELQQRSVLTQPMYIRYLAWLSLPSLSYWYGWQRMRASFLSETSIVGTLKKKKKEKLLLGQNCPYTFEPISFVQQSLLEQIVVNCSDKYKQLLVW